MVLYKTYLVLGFSQSLEEGNVFLKVKTIFVSTKPRE